MKPICASRLMLALAFAGASFAAAAQTGDEDHGVHHPDAAAEAPAPVAPASRPAPTPRATPAPAARAPRPDTAAGGTAPAYSIPALQQRMKSIRDESDPAHRLALIDEQIRALEAATQAASAECPMQGGMMNGGMMQGGMMNGGMMPGGGKAGGATDGRGAAAPRMAPSQPGAAMTPMSPPGPDMMREHMRMMERHMNMMEQMMRMHGQMHPEPAQR